MFNQKMILAFLVGAFMIFSCKNSGGSKREFPRDSLRHEIGTDNFPAPQETIIAILKRNRYYEMRRTQPYWEECGPLSLIKLVSVGIWLLK